MEKIIAGKSITVNDEGFMTDFKQWDKEIGDALAKESNIEMTPRHWK
jgi:sulfur relay (sulfurtransferase) DsrC/TusE family protein